MTQTDELTVQLAHLGMFAAAGWLLYGWRGALACLLIHMAWPVGRNG